MSTGQADACRCPRWVKSCPVGAETLLPLCTYQRTPTDRRGWSVSCQKRISGHGGVFAASVVMSDLGGVADNSANRFSPVGAVSGIAAFLSITMITSDALNMIRQYANTQR